MAVAKPPTTKPTPAIFTTKPCVGGFWTAEYHVEYFGLDPVENHALFISTELPRSCVLESCKTLNNISCVNGTNKEVMDNIGSYFNYTSQREFRPWRDCTTDPDFIVPVLLLCLGITWIFNCLVMFIFGKWKSLFKLPAKNERKGLVEKGKFEKISDGKPIPKPAVEKPKIHPYAPDKFPEWNPKPMKPVKPKPKPPNEEHKMLNLQAHQVIAKPNPYIRDKDKIDNIRVHFQPRGYYDRPYEYKDQSNSIEGEDIYDDFTPPGPNMRFQRASNNSIDSF